MIRHEGLENLIYQKKYLLNKFKIKDIIIVYQRRTVEKVVCEVVDIKLRNDDFNLPYFIITYKIRTGKYKDVQYEEKARADGERRCYGGLYDSLALAVLQL